MQMGASEAGLVAQMLADGIELPEHLKNVPSLDMGLELFYNAFQELTTCRQIGMSLGPIPWTATDTYCVRHDIIGEQREDMFYHIDRLDEVYRDEVAKQAKKKKKG